MAGVIPELSERRSKGPSFKGGKKAGLQLRETGLQHTGTLVHGFFAAA